MSEEDKLEKWQKEIIEFLTDGRKKEIRPSRKHGMVLYIEDKDDKKMVETNENQN